MAPRGISLTSAFAAVAVLTVLSVRGLPLQTQGRSGRISAAGRVELVSPSVIASWRAHGADDFIIENASPPVPLLPPSPPTDNSQIPQRSGGANVPPPPGVAVELPRHDWILDFVVLRRWPGQAPPFTTGAVGDELGGPKDVDRIFVGNRELRIQFNPEANTAQIGDGPLVSLKGVNVLMLDVGEREVSVAGTAMVYLRYPSDPGFDAMAALIARSPEVAAFVNRTR